MGKKIIYHIDDISHPGGMERIVVLKANWLAEHGYQVTMLTVGKQVDPYFPLSDKVEREALDVFRGKLWDTKRNLWGALKSVWWSIKSRADHKRKLRKYLEKNSCDYFITLINRGFIPRLKDGSKKYFEIHFSVQARKEFRRLAPYPYRIFYDLGMWWQERVYKRYDKFIVLTEKDVRLRGNMPNMLVIPNFITVDIPDREPNKSSKRVISVGRLSMQKGYDYLFRAWKTVVEKYPDWHLDIYGYGYGREAEYNQMIRQAGVEGYAEIHEPVTGIQTEYLTSAFYVMSSRYEGFPLVLSEAMACGLPCVSYNCHCGPDEIIRRGEDGLIVDEVGDIEGLANAMMYMIEHPEERKRMGRRAKENIMRFRIDNVMKKWTEILP